MRKILGSLISASAIGMIWFASDMPVHAQEDQRNVMVVFDGSGSMWGRINGRHKIEIARETLSQVLSETTLNMNLGMIAYGHRQKGQCSDIETIVRAGPSRSTVPAMISAANAIKPKGKTPLSDAVRIAAEELHYTENEATVVLVTDGIETCDANPCALANELESAGINFTTHVVGFGLSRDEGRQVACLAENTGGKYFPADDADGLSDALQETFAALPDDDDFEDVTPIRNVRFIFRDTPDGEQIGIRQLSGIVEKADGSAINPDSFEFAYPEGSGLSAKAKLEPGQYVGLFERKRGSGGYTIRYEFEIPEGDGTHTIEASLSGSLKINAFINPNLSYKSGDPFPTAIGGSRPRMHFEIFAIKNGESAVEPVAKTTILKHVLPLATGKYLIKGNLDSTISAEQMIEVQAGGQTEVDFSFDATRVFIDAQDAGGNTITRQTAYWYDKVPSGRNYWVSGRGVRKNGLVPFYLPTGSWITNVGKEGGGKKRSEVVVEVPGDYQDIRLKVGEAETLSEENKTLFNSSGYQGCAEFLKVTYNGCLVKQAQSSNASQKTAALNEETGGQSDFEDASPQSTAAQSVKEIGSPLPPQQAFNAFNGIFASVGFDQNASDKQLAEICSTKPVLVLGSGVLAFKRLDSNSFVTDEVRYCTKHASGELDCSPAPVSNNGKSLDVNALDTSAPLISLRNFDPVAGTVESCLAGPDGRDGPRLCTYMQQCTREAMQTVGREARASIFDAPRFGVK